MLDIKKFDTLIEKTTAGGLDTFEEIAKILSTLIRLEVDGSKNKLIQEVSEHAKCTSKEDFQTFLNEYVEFHNALIFELDRIDAIKNDILYENSLSELSEELLYSIDSNNARENVLKISSKIFETALDEYSIEFIEEYDENLRQLTKIFGHENVAMYFLGVAGVIVHFSSQEVDKEEIMDSMATVLTLCMALNTLRKKHVASSGQDKSTHATAVNSTHYNVGRNDPCPCGSGRKYKKCCLNKTQMKPL